MLQSKLPSLTVEQKLVTIQLGAKRGQVKLRRPTTIFPRDTSFDGFIQSFTHSFSLNSVCAAHIL